MNILVWGYHGYERLTSKLEFDRDLTSFSVTGMMRIGIGESSPKCPYDVSAIFRIFQVSAF
jgi:hypothetical protein